MAVETAGNDRRIEGNATFTIDRSRATMKAATTLSLFALLIGTLQLSRALADRQLADEVLERGIENALALLHRT